RSSAGGTLSLGRRGGRGAQGRRGRHHDARRRRDRERRQQPPLDGRGRGGRGQTRGRRGGRARGGGAGAAGGAGRGGPPRGPIEVGDAVATGAGRLKARWVVHGAVMGQDLRTNADLVRDTTGRCLEVADELGARSLALPAFGTGVGGFPLDECARIMVAVARGYGPRNLEEAVFAVFGDEARRAFDTAL